MIGAAGIDEANRKLIQIIQRAGDRLTRGERDQ